MEEMKNGMISEEALEKVAGGINVNKEVLRKVLLGAGIGVAAVLTATGVRDLCKSDKKPAGSPVEPKSTASTTVNPDDVPEPYDGYNHIPFLELE